MNALLNKINSLELDKQKITLIVFVLAFIVYADFAFVVKVQSGLSKKLSGKITKVSQDLKKFKKDAAEIESTKARQGVLKQIAKKIISEEEIGGLLSSISDIANKHNIRIIQIKPNRQVPVQSKKNQPVTSATPLLVNLELITNYHSLGTFISNLEDEQIFFSVKGVKISRLAKDPFNENVSLELVTYVKK
ncbi:MAG: type 4a pilus biogenesis protein PilO [Candidatus Omnitrophica bacterium]|nr:type 4a pilus biogenesis protein PilO [Candidatus Omnitrophota bacterium]MDD5653446.1 type 4a pilus biogenesis protein PilO [Candidatus Omnitrophota bacterium]